MAGQREKVFTALTVYIPGTDEKAKGGGGRSCDSERGLDPCISNCTPSLPFSTSVVRRCTFCRENGLCRNPRMHRGPGLMRLPGRRKCTIVLLLFFEGLLGMCLPILPGIRADGEECWCAVFPFG